MMLFSSCGPLYPLVQDNEYTAESVRTVLGLMLEPVEPPNLTQEQRKAFWAKFNQPVPLTKEEKEAFLSWENQATPKY
jgi:hypothetical protein